MKNQPLSINRIRLLIAFFMSALVVSGLTAIPLRPELDLLNRWAGVDSLFAGMFPAMAEWISRVNHSVQNGYGTYPLLAYGTDWLAFGHVAIAVAFIGPLRDPVKNIWVLEFGMIACLLVIPWAVIFGMARGIPAFWTLIDISFGLIGILPLWFARRETLRLASK